jgi:hypothetical protein
MIRGLSTLNDADGFEHKVRIPLSGEAHFLEVCTWCDKNIGPNEDNWYVVFSNEHLIYSFKNKDNAVWFSLRWS